jgi:Fur family transcriptional regulator, ferric uptake regulator
MTIVAIRNTQDRLALNRLLQQVPKPLTEPEIRKKLGFPVHKTTVYRLLGKMVQEGLAQIALFEDGITRYELARAHHHHVICRKCKRVEDITVAGDLRQEERRIARRTHFRNVSHELDFYGVCSTCA